MAPTIHLIRHAHAQNIVGKDADPDIRDPSLTDVGFSQCKELGAEITRRFGSIDIIFTSPMRRTIQTALAAFEKHTKHTRAVVLPLLQPLDPIPDCPAEQGSDYEDLVKEFGSDRLDWSFMTPDDRSKVWDEMVEASGEDLRAAPRAARLFLRTVAQLYRHTDAHIVVITHSQNIGSLAWTLPAVYRVGEYRSFQFASLTTFDGTARLVETAASEAWRKHEKASIQPFGEVPGKKPSPQRKRPAPIRTDINFPMLKPTIKSEIPAQGEPLTSMAVYNAEMNTKRPAVDSLFNSKVS
ncbi:histidine phosphatase superfamily [Astrocystis sublimbata]|nr:histidine phosphatase superfamily [Astrocystis sublimbata]